MRSVRITREREKMSTKAQERKSIWTFGVPVLAKSQKMKRILAIAGLFLFVVLVYMVISGWRQIEADKYFVKANHAHMNGDFKKGKKLYEKALALNPSHADANFGLAMIMAKKDTKQAIKLYKKAIAIEPGNADYNAWLAYIYQNEQKDSAKAIVWMEKAIEIEPENFQYRLAISTFFINANKTDDAINHLERAIKLSPDVIVPHQKLAQLYTSKGLDKQAREHEKIVQKLTKDSESGPDVIK